MIDLRTCKPGDKLRSSHGSILTYVGPTEEGHEYDHYVQYRDGSLGTRTHDGHVFREKRMPEYDQDIVKILKE